MKVPRCTQRGCRKRRLPGLFLCPKHQRKESKARRAIIKDAQQRNRSPW